jgi:hypothetical protein
MLMNDYNFKCELSRLLKFEIPRYFYRRENDVKKIAATNIAFKKSFTGINKKVN